MPLMQSAWLQPHRRAVSDGFGAEDADISGTSHRRSVSAIKSRPKFETLDDYAVTRVWRGDPARAKAVARVDSLFHLSDTSPLWLPRFPRRLLFAMIIAARPQVAATNERLIEPGCASIDEIVTNALVDGSPVLEVTRAASPV